jgi:hypothetical protein
LSLSTFTAVHVALSLIGIASGVFVLLGMLRSQRAAGLTAVFLLTTIATSVTGFLFPSTHLVPGHMVGVLSLIVLVPTLLALYQHRLVGPWRRLYVIGATTALYLNVVIGIWQAFGKIGVLHAWAPSLTAPPLVGVQLVVLAIFIVLGVLAVKRFHPEIAPRVAVRTKRRSWITPVA